MDVFFGLFLSEGCGGFALDPDLLDRLAKLGLEIGLDIYCLVR